MLFWEKTQFTQDIMRQVLTSEVRVVVLSTGRDLNGALSINKNVRLNYQITEVYKRFDIVLIQHQNNITTVIQ